MAGLVKCMGCNKDDKTNFVLVCETGHSCCLECADACFECGDNKCPYGCSNKFWFATNGNWIPNNGINKVQKEALCVEEESQEKIDADCRPGGSLYMGRNHRMVLKQQREICKQKIREMNKRKRSMRARIERN